MGSERFRELLGWWTCRDAGKMACQEGAWKLLASSQIRSLMLLFHLVIPELYPFIIIANLVSEKKICNSL